MGRYTIKIEYTTGNSFTSEDTSDVITLSWDNLEIAKENLLAIKEHWFLNIDLGSYF
jgi:hypothetical protein